MKFKKTVVFGLLAGAMVGMSSMSAPAFADPAYSSDSNYIQKVDWWWDHYQNDQHNYANYGWHKGYYEYSGHKYACDRARGLQSQVWQDRRSGHPAAANDVEAEAAAARERCYSRN
jgi:hypothetical protein